MNTSQYRTTDEYDKDLTWYGVNDELPKHGESVTIETKYWKRLEGSVSNIKINKNTNVATANFWQVSVDDPELHNKKHKVEFTQWQKRYPKNGVAIPLDLFGDMDENGNEIPQKMTANDIVMSITLGVIMLGLILFIFA